MRGILAQIQPEFGVYREMQDANQCSVDLNWLRRGAEYPQTVESGYPAIMQQFGVSAHQVQLEKRDQAPQTHGWAAEGRPSHQQPAAFSGGLWTLSRIGPLGAEYRSQQLLDAALGQISIMSTLDFRWDVVSSLV